MRTIDYEPLTSQSAFRDALPAIARVTLISGGLCFALCLWAHANLVRYQRHEGHAVLNSAKDAKSYQFWSGELQFGLAAGVLAVAALYIFIAAIRKRMPTLLLTWAALFAIGVGMVFWLALVSFEGFL